MPSEPVPLITPAISNLSDDGNAVVTSPTFPETVSGPDVMTGPDANRYPPSSTDIGSFNVIGDVEASESWAPFLTIVPAPVAPSAPPAAATNVPVLTSVVP